MSSDCLAEIVDSFTLKIIRMIKVKTKASRLSADTGNTAPTALVTRTSRGGIDMININPKTEISHMRAYPT